MSKPRNIRPPDKNDRDGVVASIAKYTSSNLYRRVLGVLFAFIKPKLLSPEVYGLWNLLKLIVNYTPYMDLGANGAVRFLLPYHLARGEKEICDSIKGSAFYGTLAIRLILVLGMLGLALWGNFDNRIRWGLAAMTVVICIHWYQEYYINLLKSYQEFWLVARTNYLFVNLYIFGGIALMFLLGIYGLYIAIVVAHLGVAIYIRHKHAEERGPAFRFTLHRFIGLVRMGFPITLFSFFAILTKSGDRIIVASLLGTRELGFYAIAASVFGFFMQIPGAAREVLEPRLMEGLGRDSKEDAISEFFFKPLINTAFYLPMLIGPVIFLFPSFIDLLLPRYQSSVLPTQIVVLGGYFLALFFVSRGYIVSHSWQTRALVFMVCTLTTNVLLSIGAVKLGLGITGIAISGGISYFFLFTITLWYIRHRSELSKAHWRPVLRAISLPYPFTCIVLALVFLFTSLLPIHPYLLGVLNTLVFFAIMVGFINLASRRIELLQAIDLRRPWRIVV